MPVRSPAVPRGLAGTIGRALLFILLFTVCTIAAQGMLASPITWLVALTGLHVRLGDLVGLAGVLAATAVMVRAVDVRPWRDVGLGRANASVRAVGWGTALGGGAIGAACALLLALHWLRVEPSLPGSRLQAAFVVTTMLLPAALFEELVCRGYLLTALRDSVGGWWAVGLTSVLFGLGHLQNAGATAESLLVVVLAGVFLGAVRLAFDSLYAAWGAHVAWNWVMAVPLHAAVSGLRFESPDYRTVSAGPAWLTGGAWGPEGGLVAGLGLVGALAILHARHRRAHDALARPGREESRDDG